MIDSKKMDRLSYLIGNRIEAGVRSGNENKETRQMPQIDVYGDLPVFQELVGTARTI